MSSQQITSLNHRQRLSLVEKDLLRENAVKAKRKREDIDLLAMKKPTTIDDIRSRIPNPRDTLPPNALPEWKERPLDSKLPAVPAPEGTFLVSQGEVGRKLFVSTPKHGFDMSDPLLKETPVEYQPLHDPNLREFFYTNHVVCRQLVELGLVTCDGKVIANLNDLNKYRAYLSRVQNEEVSREKKRIEVWEKCQHEREKKIKRYIQKLIKDQNEEERKQRRERNKREIEEKHRQRKVKSLEHPSNYLKEKRVIEAKLRKAKREALRKNVMDRLKRIRDGDKRRARHILLEWICKDQFREKLRNVIKLERELNKQESLVEFVDNKRVFQERKQRYQKALLLRDKIETECRVQLREAGYARQQEQDLTRAIKNRESAREREARHQVLAQKYGHKWLDIVRQHKRDAMHDSAWHIRSVLLSLLQYVKSESGAKNFTEYLHEILSKKKDSIDPETKKVVMCILDALIERSYKEFIRRATNCLVDFVVEESRKRVLGFVCEAGLDPSDLEVPIVPKRKKGQITLRKPTYPLDGPCTHFARTGEWPNRCVEELERLHGRLCISLLKKLTSGMTKARRTCGDDELDRLEDRAKKARDSQRVCQAVDMVTRMTMERAKGCFKGKQPCPPLHKVNDVCDELAGALLGPGQTSKGKSGKSRRRSKGGKKKHGMGVGPGGSMGKADTGTVSDAFATSDSEVDGAQIAPLIDSGAGSEYGDRGTTDPFHPGRDRGVGGGRPGGRDESIGRGPGADKGIGKEGPPGASKGTSGSGAADSGTLPNRTSTAESGAGGAGAVDKGLGPGAGAETGVGDSRLPTGKETGTAGEGGAEGGTQASTGEGEDEGVGAGVDKSDAGVGQGVSTSEGGTSGPGAAEAGTGGPSTAEGGAGTEGDPSTADESTGGGEKAGKGVDATGEGGVTEGTDGKPLVDRKTGESGVPTASQGTEAETGVDRGVGKDGAPGVDTGVGGTPGVDQGIGGDGGRGTSSAAAGSGHALGQDRGTGEPKSTKEAGADGGPGIPGTSTGVGKDGYVDREQGFDGVPTGSRGTVTDGGVDQGVGTDKAGGVERGDGTDGAPTDSRGVQKEGGVDAGAEAEGIPTDSRGTSKEGGVDQGAGTDKKGGVDAGEGTGGIPTDSHGVGKEGGVDTGEGTEGVPTDSRGTSKEGGVDSGVGPPGTETAEAGTGGRPGKEAGVDGETPSTDDKAAGKEPGKEGGTDAEGLPGKDGATDAERLPGAEGATSTEPGAEKGTEAAGPGGPEEGVGTETGGSGGREEGVGTEAAGPGGRGEGVGAEAGPGGREEGVGTEGTGAEAGTEAKVPAKDEGIGAGGPAGTEAGTAPEGGQETGTTPEGVSTETEGTEADRGQEEGEGTGPGAPKKDRDGTQTDLGEEAGVGGAPGEPGMEQGVGASPDEEEKGTEPVRVGSDRGDQTEGPEKASKGADAEGLGPDKAVGPEGVSRSDQAVGPCAPCACNVPCPPDAWDGKEFTEEELDNELFRVDELLDNVKNELLQKCLTGEGLPGTDPGGAGGGPGAAAGGGPGAAAGGGPGAAAGGGAGEYEGLDPDNPEVAQAMDDEIDDLITNELATLLDTDSCLEKAGEYLKEKCAQLSGDSKQKCLEEAARQLREQCLTLSDAEREKCLRQVNHLLSRTPSEYTGISTDSEDLSRNASGFVHAILREQKAKLSNELAVVGAGDEDAIGRILSDDNISRIASALVKQSICVAKCGSENLRYAGYVAPSPGVRCSVRDKLQHIRSILDEVKSDLAEVGIRPPALQVPPIIITRSGTTRHSSSATTQVVEEIRSGSQTQLLSSEQEQQTEEDDSQS